jgi:hypothetical protein
MAATVIHRRHGASVACGVLITAVALAAAVLPAQRVAEVVTDPRTRTGTALGWPAPDSVAPLWSVGGGAQCGPVAAVAARGERCDRRSCRVGVVGVLPAGSSCSPEPATAGKKSSLPLPPTSDEQPSTGTRAAPPFGHHRPAAAPATGPDRIAGEVDILGIVEGLLADQTACQGDQSDAHPFDHDDAY